MSAIREIWDSRVAFIMAAIGSAVGLGNIWRFPATAYENGGGAFLIPYFVALFTAGIPIMMIEFWLGKKFQLAAPNAFEKIKKGWRFFGWLATLAAAVIVFYYAVVMSWCWVFLFNSLKLPWAGQETSYFFNDLLQIAKSPGLFDGFVWPVVLGLLLTWICIYFIISKGVSGVGKIVMITVPLPVILVVILAIRGISLPGAISGLNFYLMPNFKSLLDPKVWLAAYSQIFFSLSLGFGVLLAYASYLPKKADITNNAFITSLSNCLFSFFAGFAVFSTLGYLSNINNIGIASLKISGPTLAFITYPAALAKLPFASILSVIFFSTLLFLGIDSAFSIVESLVTTSMDNSKLNRKKLSLIICGVSFVAGLIFTTKSGLYWLDVVDHFIMAYMIAFIGLIQCILIGWFADTKKIAKEIDDQSELKFGRVWIYLIKFVAPVILTVLILQNFIKELSAPYGGYAPWLIVSGGWLVVLSIFVISYFLYTSLQSKK